MKAETLIFIAVLMLLCTAAATVSAADMYFPTDNGDGTAGNPFRITNETELRELANLTNTGATYLDEGETRNYNSSHYRVTDTIILPNYGIEGWNPIGNNSPTSNQFNGTFDGGEHTIHNLSTTNASADYQGLFGFAGSGSSISNVSLVNVNVTGDSSVGGLVGRSDGSIENSFATGSVNGGSSIGGLVGYAAGGSSITNSYAGGNVTGSGGFVGGLVGLASGGITNSYATGFVNVTGIINNIGGLVGYADGSIENSFATGSVTGNNNVGGLVGDTSSSSNIDNSYATGSVTGNNNVGGFMGSAYGSIANSYAAGSVNGNERVGGLVGRAYDNSNIDNSYATGSVTGSNNVGGLVGRAYENSNIDNSYTTGSVSGNNNVGGLMGLAAESTITNSTALNHYVNGSAYVNRVLGYDDGGVTLTSNFAWDGMTNGGQLFSEDGSSGLNGTNVTSEQIWANFTTTNEPWIGWDTGIWTLSSAPNYELPILAWQTAAPNFDAMYLAPQGPPEPPTQPATEQPTTQPPTSQPSTQPSTTVPQFSSGSDDGLQLLAEAILEKYKGKELAVSDVKEILRELENAGFVSGTGGLSEEQLSKIAEEANKYADGDLTAERIVDLVRESWDIIATPAVTQTVTSSVSETGTVQPTGSAAPEETASLNPTETEAVVPVAGAALGLLVLCMVLRRK